MAALQARRQAANTSFDPTGTTLTATNVQEAIEEAAGMGGPGGDIEASTVIYNNLASGISATNIQDAVDYLALATPPAYIRPTRVIRDGVEGVEYGTLNETDATANRTTVNAIIASATTAQAWIEPDPGSINIGGGPLLIGNGTRWAGSFQTNIVQRSNNQPILQIGLTGGATTYSNIVFDGASLFYGSDQAGNTNANMLVLGNMWQCDIRNIRCNNTTSTNRPYRCIYIPQGQTFFTNSLTNIFAFQAYQSNLHINNFGTGNSLRNIYLSGVGPAGTAQAVAFPFLWDVNSQQVHDSHGAQVNLEWHRTNRLMSFNNVRSPSFSSLHIEQNQLTGAGASYVYSGIANLKIDALMNLDNWIQTGSGNVTDAIPAFFKCFNDGMILVDTYTHNNNSGSYINTAYYLAYQDTNDGYNSNPSLVTINHPQFVDAAGTSIQTYQRLDRNLGGTDMDGAVWPGMILLRARSVELNNVLPEVKGGVYRLTGTPQTSRIYGSMIGGKMMVQVSGSLAASTDVILDNFMAPTGGRWASAPVPDGWVVEFRRAGTHTNDFNIKRHDGTTLVTMANGSGSSRRYAVKVAGQWTAT